MEINIIVNILLLHYTSCVLNRQDYLVAAKANALFLLQSMTSDGYLLHVYNQGQARIEGFLEDYAMVIDGLLKIHQATFSGEWLTQAGRLAETMTNLFWSESESTFYDTGDRHQALFVRPRSIHDGALPSGASAATLVLFKIARLTGKERWEQIARQSLQSIHSWISRYPQGYGNWLCTLDFYLSEPRDIVFVGPRDNSMTQQLLDVLFGSWFPNTVMVAFNPEDRSPALHMKLLEHKGMVNNQPTVYLCENYSCRSPVTDPDSLRHQLHQVNTRKALPQD